MSRMADLDFAVREYVESRRALSLLMEDEQLKDCTSVVQSVMTLCIVSADNLLDAIIPEGCEIESGDDDLLSVAHAARLADLTGDARLRFDV